MPTSLNIDVHLAALDAAGRAMFLHAARAGLDARVPTCPAWDMRALLAHQTMVHRWAAAHVRGEDTEALPNQTTIRSTVADLPSYFTEGLAVVVDALRTAPEDLRAMTFLNDAPAPRQFWARRQAHETTIHAVDALAAELGRVPTTAEAAIAGDLAADGLDELLRGFFTRGRSKLYDGADVDVLVAPTDSDRRWLLHISEKMTVAPGDATTASAAATLTGTCAGLYLALWNRGDDLMVDGDATVLARWRANHRVGWS